MPSHSGGFTSGPDLDHAGQGLGPQDRGHRDGLGDPGAGDDTLGPFTPTRLLGPAEQAGVDGFGQDVPLDRLQDVRAGLESIG